MLSEAQTIVEWLPSHESGKAVLDPQGLLYRQGSERLKADLQEHAVVFHEGRIRGVWPVLSDDRPCHSQ